MNKLIKIAAVVALASATGVAVAQDVGLYFEQEVQVDGLKLHRIRDTKEHVVCYVLTGKAESSGYYTLGIHTIAGGVSCLRETP